MEDYIDDLYLLFLGGGSYFLLPLCYVCLLYTSDAADEG